MTESACFRWTVLLPVKVLARAKSRLAVLAGDRRGELALAFASDTITAVLRCPEVAHVVVITSDPVAGPPLTALGAVVVPDEPAYGPLSRVTTGTPVSVSPNGTKDAVSPDDAPVDLGMQEALNAALRHGALVAARRWPGAGLAALTADLPALGPAELSVALRAAGTTPGRPTFVPDAAGIGTTLYAVPPGAEFRPLFGGASRARHTAAGAVELGLADTFGLRRDVDTPDDLREALALGVGPRTRAAAVGLFTDV